VLAGFSTKRLQGPERRATARAVADEIAARNASPAATAFVSEDQLFVDSLGISAIASDVSDGKANPILLNQRGTDVLDSSLSAFLAGHTEVTHVQLLGGGVALAPDLEATLLREIPHLRLVDRLQGDTRFSTNRAIQDTYMVAPATVVIANGDNAALPGAGLRATSTSGAGLFSALLAGDLAGSVRAPLLITHADELPGVMREYLVAHSATITKAYIVGSLEQVSRSIEDLVAGLL
jgi:hypothetical protein